MTIGQRTAIGDRLNLITLEVPGPQTLTPDGRFTDTWTALTPSTMYGRVAPATQADQEQIAAGTALTLASRLVTIPYHGAVSTQTRLSWIDRHGTAHVANVTGFSHSADETETFILCEELAP